MKRWLKRTGIFMAMVASLFGGFLYWAAGGRQAPGEHAGAVTLHGPRGDVSPPPSGDAPKEAPRTLTVMTWNIAYARGTNPDNNANEVPSKAEAETRLRAMGALIKAHKADLVLLQEVDFASRRSRHIDQLATLAKYSGLPYSARAVSWKARWVPHPLWPPHKQYGSMLSGGGVLSRFPITQNKVVLHEKPKENGALYNAFYLFRYSQFVTLGLGGGKTLVAVNNHLEAFKKANRVAQAKQLVSRLEALPEPRPLLLCGGDLNTTPPEAAKKHGFSDSSEDDYRDDGTLPALRALPAMSELVGVDEYRRDEAAFFTFPTAARTRRLDYLFFDRRLTLQRREFLRPGRFSDHCPVVAVFSLGPPSKPSASKPSASMPSASRPSSGSASPTKP